LVVPTELIVDEVLCCETEDRCGPTAGGGACSRCAGHGGKHVAHGANCRILAWWKNIPDNAEEVRNII
jgi:hypothetical protein